MKKSYRYNYMFNKQILCEYKQLKTSYFLFIICLYPVISSFIWNFSYYLELKNELLFPANDLNVEMAKSIIDNFSYIDLVMGFTQDIEMYLSFIIILIGLLFGDFVYTQIRNNAYYIMRNRLSFMEYKLLIYKTILIELFKIELVLTIIIYLLAIILGGFNPSVILFVESLIPFVFVYFYSSLLILITINLNFKISNIYALKLLPFILMYVPILSSTILFKIVPNPEYFVKFSYLTFIPTFSYSTTESHVNIWNLINGSLNTEDALFLTQGIEPFVIPYIVLITVTLLTFNVGKEREWYV